MDPCPFVRIVIGNLAVKFPDHRSFPCYCKIRLKGFSTQVLNIPLQVQESDAVASKIHAYFSLNKPEMEKLAEKSKTTAGKLPLLEIEIYMGRREDIYSCGFMRRKKLVGYVAVLLDLKGFIKNYSNNSGSCVIQNGWVLICGSEAKLNLDVRAEPDPRFVFKFDGEPECSPQVFQVSGNVKQPVFTCKFSFRNSGERNLRCRSSLSEPSTSTSCLSSVTADKEQPMKERKGWSITVHDLSGSPVAAASMVTPFVPSPGTDRVSRYNPGAWLILRHGHSTWKPWGRLEAWREGNGGFLLGYRFELISEGGIDTIPLANSTISAKNGGKFSIDITTGSTPMTSPNSSFDLSSGSGSGTDFGSTTGSGSLANMFYRGFVMSATVEGDGKCSQPEVEIGMQHITCTEDAAAFVALAAAMDLSMDACRLFSQKLKKQLRQFHLE
ncbi:uncharacterized protein LOC111410174 [Olea europaea var. sylvestris]|uniref:uncharacterized protein LOC111410174 n=1 Tax=Olea europaea var. sylvestris TaxID=158386 RepID=UPI000C1D87A1|nr:uncharacterized protein LOC111410174 [Olea europaea var. sylvestris]